MTAWDEALNLGMDFDNWMTYKEEGKEACYYVNIEYAWHEEYIKRELTYKDLISLEALVGAETGVVLCTGFVDDKIEIAFVVEDSEDMDFEEATTKAWPVIASVQNFLDPGTFGCVYAFERKD